MHFTSLEIAILDAAQQPLLFDKELCVTVSQVKYV